MLPCQSEQKLSSLHAGCRLFTCPLIPLKGLTAATMPLWRTTRQLATVAGDAEAFLHEFGTGWGRHSVVHHVHTKVHALSLSQSLSLSLVCARVCVGGGGGLLQYCYYTLICFSSSLRLNKTKVLLLWFYLKSFHMSDIRLILVLTIIKIETLHHWIKLQDKNWI